MEPKEQHGLLWKPAAHKGDAKQTTAASMFASSTLSASPALTRIWRVRYYKRENMVAPAKPLWFLAHPITLEKNQVVRVV